MLTSQDTMSRWAEEVTAYREGLVAGKTLDTDRYHIKHGLPARLGDHPIKDLSPVTIEDAAAQMLRDGYTRATVKRSLVTLSVILGRARKLGQLDDGNPCKLVELPPGSGAPSRPIHPLTADELRAMHRSQRNLTPQADLTLLLGLSGLRWSEARELRTRDIQIEPFPAIRVSRARPDGHDVKTTKGRNARLVPLVPEAAAVVLPRLSTVDPDKLIFPTRAGTSILSPNYRRATNWPRTGKGRRIHDLRHTAAVLWLGSGLDVKTVQAWLGHQSATLTLDLYGAYRSTDADVAALGRLTEALKAA